MKKKKKQINRDRLILAAYQRQINLGLRVVKSKKDYNRQDFKNKTKQEIEL